jgi:hypothetical protein
MKHDEQQQSKRSSEARGTTKHKEQQKTQRRTMQQNMGRSTSEA